MKTIFTLAAISIFGLTPCFAQAPAMSHDAQKLPVSANECTRMGERTLRRAGYQVGPSDQNWVSGSRDIHRALILCHATPDGTWADVIISSNAQETAVAGSEQRLLMSYLLDMMRNGRGDDRDRDRDGDRDRDRDRRGNWVNMTGKQPLPSNAVPGGREPNHPVPQYVCRAELDGNWVPGKTVTAGDSNDCYVPYRDGEVRKASFDLLIGNPDEYVWARPDGGGSPFYTGTEGGGPLRSCRFELRVGGDNKGLHLGKEMGGRCFVSYKGVAYPSDRYEVLYRNR
ncbi:MAG TPA: DM9 repeat-containing protein [Candidatus Angelobacter sp.]|nr:DM9 repeat-containing protein [Candidatus Angelobacter sp.]